MKKRPSLSIFILVLNIISCVVLAGSFCAAFLIIGRKGVDRILDAKAQDVSLTTSEYSDYLYDYYSNLFASINYSEDIQENIINIESDPDNELEYKKDIRNSIDKGIVLNNMMHGYVISSMDLAHQYQSSSRILTSDKIKYALDVLADYNNVFFLNETYEYELYFAQKFAVEISETEVLEYFSVGNVDYAFFFNYVVPTNDVFNFKINLSHHDRELIKQSDVSGIKVTTKYGFNIEVCRGDEINNLIKAFINPIIIITSIVVLLLVAILLNIINTRIISKPIKELSNYCKEIPTKIKDIPLDEIKYDEPYEISKQINEMVSNIESNERQLSAKQLELYNEKLEKQNIALSMLFSQINSHFLYNTLSNIRGMALKAKNEDISDALHLLVQYFRYCSDQSDFTTIGKEVSFIDIYLKIQTLRFGESFFKYEIECSDDLREEIIPRYIIQPLIENCFSHGFINKEKDCFIKISFQKENGKKVIYVIDNGEGCDQSIVDSINNNIEIMKDHSTNGCIGISNIKKRLKILYSSWDFVFESSKEGTKIKVIL